MLYFLGTCDNISVVVRTTLVQMLTPDDMRGRVSALNGLFIGTSNELGAFESGLVAGLFGPVFSVVFGGHRHNPGCRRNSVVIPTASPLRPTRSGWILAPPCVEFKRHFLPTFIRRIK